MREVKRFVQNCHNSVITCLIHDIFFLFVCDVCAAYVIILVNKSQWSFFPHVFPLFNHTQVLICFAQELSTDFLRWKAIRSIYVILKWIVYECLQFCHRNWISISSILVFFSAFQRRTSNFVRVVEEIALHRQLHWFVSTFYNVLH